MSILVALMIQEDCSTEQHHCSENYHGGNLCVAVDVGVGHLPTFVSQPLEKFVEVFISIFPDFMHFQSFL